jgi:hypothetical protein
MRRWAVLFSVAFFLLNVPAAGAESPASTAEDRAGLEVTVYNVSLGLVKDQREVSVPAGESELKFMNVASWVNPASVRIRSITDPESLSVLEQNFEYDLLSPEKLMEKYVGKEVRIVTKNPYTDKEEVVTATILSVNNGVVLRIGDEITFGYEGRMIFPSVPENLISRPTLVWLLSNTLDTGKQVIEVAYLTEGIAWSADYVLTLAGGEDEAGLAGWVTIDNQSGATYEDARVKLVAGDVARVQDDQLMAFAMERKALRADEDQFAERAFFEYHLYTLGRTTTIKDNQEKQISLLSAEGIPLRKEYVYRGAVQYYTSRYRQLESDKKVGVYVEFENREEDNLGMPLPAGTVRLYKADHEGSLQFLGEDSIDHTPRDETVRVKVGEAFDVKGSRKQTDWEKLGSTVFEAAFEVTLRNRKEEDIVVKVMEPIPGDWKMIDASHDYEKEDAFTVAFELPVEAGGETVLSYRVRMKF